MHVNVRYFVVIATLASCSFAWGNSNTQSTFDKVKDRGYLICGVGENNEGFIKHNDKSYRDEVESVFTGSTGLEADLCRAIAIATFGNGYKESTAAFKILTLDGRFDALATGEVDVVLFSATWTFSRDVQENVDFGPIYYHDSQKFLVRKDQIPPLNELIDLNGKTICVRGNTESKNTTTIDNLISISDQFNLGWKFETDFLTFEDLRIALEQDKPDCDAVAGDESSLISLKGQADREAGTEKLSIMPEMPLSYEPLAAMVAENDSRWLDVVSYAIRSTIWAEQQGIKKRNAREFATDSWETLTGEKATGYMIIDELGNYGEIFERNLGFLVPTEQRGRNQPKQINIDGWMVPPPMESSTIKVTKPIRTQFASGQSTVTDKMANEILEFFSDIHREFKQNTIVDIGVSGHTDNVGSHEVNFELSENRAIAVADYIAEKIVEKDDEINVKIDPKGFGESVPVEPDSNETPEGRLLNRRVDISVVLQ